MFKSKLPMWFRLLGIPLISLGGYQMYTGIHELRDMSLPLCDSANAQRTLKNTMAPKYLLDAVVGPHEASSNDGERVCKAVFKMNADGKIVAGTYILTKNPADINHYNIAVYIDALSPDQTAAN